jgi:prepilin-type N-terminal cleavage/methylation domain-containing protein
MNLRADKGMTLLEVLASTTILSIVVIAFLNLSGYSLLANKKSTQIVDAQHVAEQQLHYARDYIKTDNALPPNFTKDKYTITFQHSSLANPSAIDQSSFKPMHFSLQAMVYINAQPRILTATVSWSS